MTERDSQVARVHLFIENRSIYYTKPHLGVSLSDRYRDPRFYRRKIEIPAREPLETLRDLKVVFQKPCKIR